MIKTFTTAISPIFLVGLWREQEDLISLEGQRLVIKYHLYSSSSFFSAFIFLILVFCSNQTSTLCHPSTNHTPSSLNLLPNSIIMDLQQTDMPKTPFDVYELLSKILSFLPRSVSDTIPRSVFDTTYNPVRESDSNLMCSRVCKNWLKVSRRLAFSRVVLRNEKEARRFLAALLSNEAFVDRYPAWPLMNSTKTLRLGKVNGLF
jgi:hypothetical protein